MSDVSVTGTGSRGLKYAPGAEKRQQNELAAAMGRRLGMNQGSKGISAARVRFQNGVQGTMNEVNRNIKAMTPTYRKGASAVVAPASRGKFRAT